MSLTWGKFFLLSMFLHWTSGDQDLCQINHKVLSPLDWGLQTSVKRCVCVRENLLVWNVYLLLGNFLKCGLPEDKKKEKDEVIHLHPLSDFSFFCERHQNVCLSVESHLKSKMFILYIMSLSLLLWTSCLCCWLYSQIS